MTHEKTIYLFVNGIACWPGNFTNWNKRAVTWIHTHTEHRAEAFEYFTTPLTRPFREDQRTEHFERAVHEYSRLGWKIICVGHSNGCAVILEALRRACWPRVAAIHLVCGACEADFSKNGLNAGLRDGALPDRFGVDRVFIYNAPGDWALPLAHTLPGKILGYGTLGLDGALHIDDAVKDRVGTLWFPKNFGHSTCWRPHHFSATMKHFINQTTTHPTP